MKSLLGSEYFYENGAKLPVSVEDFWKWAYSDLNSPYVRSAIAEYLVYLSAPNPKHMQDVFPRRTLISSGYRISTESAAYMQSEDPSHPDHISFKVPNAPCDIAVFCVYTGLSPESSPIDLDLWEFYVLSGETLSLFSGRRTITFQSMISLNPTPCSYTELPTVIKSTINA